VPSQPSIRPALHKIAQAEVQVDLLVEWGPNLIQRVSLVSILHAPMIAYKIWLKYVDGIQRVRPPLNNSPQTLKSQPQLEHFAANEEQ